MKIAILAVLLHVTSVANAQSDSQLVDKYDHADSAQRYESARKAALDILERYPDSATWQFNAARPCARLDRLDESIEHLQKAADLGYTGIASFDNHQDLDALRDREDFKDILEQVRDNADRRMREFQALAADHEPAVYVPDSLQDTHGEGVRPPLLVALHGTGGTGKQMVNRLKASCDKLGIICIAPDAIRPAGSGYSWTYRDESEWLIHKAATDAMAKYNTDPDATILLGFSQGANMIFAMARSEHEPFTAMIPICGHYEPNASSADFTPPPMYLMIGERDPWKATYREARSDFTESGASIQTRVVPGIGHAIPNTRDLVTAVEWAIEESRTGSL
jgi:predicted esterase